VAAIFSSTSPLVSVNMATKFENLTPEMQEKARAMYQKYFDNGARVKEKYNLNAGGPSFCQCCGALWLQKDGATLHPTYEPNGQRLHWASVKELGRVNWQGIFFGQYQTTEELIKHAGLNTESEEVHSLQFEDEGNVHALAWKDA
jgi:hypothetical protein